MEAGTRAAAADGEVEADGDSAGTAGEGAGEPLPEASNERFPERTAPIKSLRALPILIT